MIRLLLLAAFVVSPAFAEEEPAKAAVDPAKVAEILTIKETDIVLGEDNAPLTMIEYSSLSCSHCATFHNSVLPSIKKDFIDTGKLRFANRDFSLNAPALRGAMLVQCAPEDKQAKFQEVLFKLQSKWAFTPAYDEALKKIANVGGVDEAAYEACMEDEALEERVLTVRQEAGENLDIQGTPSFFINGEKFNAPLTPEAFSNALDALLND